MELIDLVLEAINTLTLNKLRTGLATLGIVIGIGSVIALVSLGQSGQKAVEAQIESLGSNLLTVIPGALRPGDIRSAAGTSTTLKLDDAKAIENRKIVGIKNVSAELLRRAQVVAGRNNTNTQIVGVLANYQEVRSLKIAFGTFLKDSDISSLAKVAVLGPQVVSDLFGEGVNPVGQSLRINRMVFKVIGVTVTKGGAGFGGNQDDIVLVPLSTAQKQLFGVDFIGSISVQVENKEQMDIVREEIGYMLLDRHKIQSPQNADFTIFSQADILGAAQQITGIFTTLLAGIAAISLLVGGIGIMNIMLVTVTERTREIGLRKALGAKKKVIIAQFLTEAIILTIAGGVIGMVFGILASFIISHLIHLPFTLSFISIILAIVISGVIGILFGLYPAGKAANLQPIEALRYE
ncbi:ABC transporter permease [Candidatus Gottesmanbacteria bacterium]|nr:ABC transporter permease [Candidatus Gottesmanbacteria bacterium]